MTPRGTRLRNVRVPDDLWAAAGSAADARGESLSVAVRRFLEAYAAGEAKHPANCRQCRQPQHPNCPNWDPHPPHVWGLGYKCPGLPAPGEGEQ